MKIKRILTAALALVMALALGTVIGAHAPAAAEEPATQGKLVIPQNDNSSTVYNTALDNLLYVNYELSEDVELEFEFSFLRNWHPSAPIFFGLYNGASNINFYGSQYLCLGSNGISADGYGYTAPDGSFVFNGGYDEQYWGNAFANRMTLKLTFDSEGNTQIYAKSTEQPELFASGSGEAIPQESFTEYRLISKLDGFGSAAFAGSPRFAFAMRDGGPNGGYEIYGVRILNKTTGLPLFDDDFTDLDTDAYVVRENLRDAIDQGVIRHVAPETPAVKVMLGDVAKTDVDINEELDLTASVKHADGATLSIEVKDKDGSVVAPKEGNVYAFDAFGTYNAVYTVKRGEEVLWTNAADPLVINVARPAVSVDTSALPATAFAGDTVDLGVTVINGVDAALTIEVKDSQNNPVQAAEDTEYTLAKQDYYYVTYTVKENGEVVWSNAGNPHKITVRNRSAQKSANVNFDDGYADGNAWTLSESGAGVSGGQLLLVNGSFTTKYASEIYYFTLDVTGISESGTGFTVLFGDAYKLKFDGTTGVTFVDYDNAETQHEVGRSAVAALKANKKVTLRLIVKSHTAALCMRIEDESVEVLETPVLTLDNLDFVGRAGIMTEEGSGISVDNVSFVNMTSVKDDNTNPGLPEDSGSSDSSTGGGNTGSTGGTDNGGGCSGAVGGSVGLVSMAVLAAALCRKKRS